MVENSMLAEVRAGLSLPCKHLSSKFFYDERGSRLFEEITRLPEYYLTRAERELLEQHVPGWVRRLRPRSLVELGAGSAEKTRVVLDAMQELGPGAVYVPVDVSEGFLREAAGRIRAEYDGDLRVVPAVSDISRELDFPSWLPRPVLFCFLGSTIGNFDPEPAARLLGRVSAGMSPQDVLLMGVDLQKEPAVIEQAYNDAGGVTADFNLNILLVINRRLGADFDPAGFRHLARYVPEQSRIEMHLVSLRPQRVSIPGMGEVVFGEGEAIRTEISRKFDPASVEEMFRAAGLAVAEWAPHPDGSYALVLAVPEAG
ncbi:MAG: L-histidine N(alpha)-methyltransferase [Longimicrobiaceae bacterium]